MEDKEQITAQKDIKMEDEDPSALENERIYMKEAIKVFQDSTIPLITDARISNVSANELTISTSWQHNCYKTNECFIGKV